MVWREDIFRTLLTNAKLLQMSNMSLWWQIPMLRRFLFGVDPIQPLSFTSNRPQAARMYLESIHITAPHGVILLANLSWSSSKPAHQKFYDHSYTIPTYKIYFLQQLQAPKRSLPPKSTNPYLAVPRASSSGTTRASPTYS